MNLNKKYTLFSLLLLIQNPIFAQARKEIYIPQGVDFVLLVIAFLLLIPICFLSKSVMSMIKKRVTEFTKNKTMLIAFLATLSVLASSFSALAQEATEAEKAAPATASVGNIFTQIPLNTWFLLGIILIEITAIIFLSGRSASLMKEKIEDEKETDEDDVPRLKTWIIEKWGKMNNFRPVDKEEGLDTGHNYDGIRELDNPAPGWFQLAFALSILFAIVYLYRHHISHSAPLQMEEYEMAMEQGEREHQAYLKSAGEQIDENSVTLLSGSDLDAGKTVYIANCAPCHGQDCEGVAAPNLTDKYWLHGGSLSDIFKSIKYGWVDKGMRSWKEDLKPKEIAQISSYIVSLRNTNAKSSRPQEGTEYTGD